MKITFTFISGKTGKAIFNMVEKILKNYIIMSLLLLLSCNLAANGLSKDSLTTTVCGRITNQTDATPKVITVIACDPLNNNDRYASRIDSSGKFQTVFDMPWAHSFTINYDKQFINLYARPGDSIYIEIDAAKFHEGQKDALLLSGDNALKNKEFSRTFNDLAGIVTPTFTDFTLSINDFMKIFNSDIRRIKNLITDYCQEQKISPWTEKLMQDMSLYILANAATDYKGQNSREALEFYTQSIFDLYNTENFRNMMFSYHLHAFLSALLRSDPLYVQEENFMKLEERGSKALLALPKSLTRDVLLFYFYKKIEGGILEIDNNNFINELVYERVLALRRSQQSIEIPTINSEKGAFFWNPKGHIENIEKFNLNQLIKEKYKGKVVYVDIWATWCSPCRAEMAPAQELHKLFHDNKDVKFVNICMKSPLKSWTKIVANGEINGDNYFFDDDLSDEAAAQLLSGGYPTFILIGKDGKIRTKKAPRPSTISQAFEAINKLLAEKKSKLSLPAN